MPRISVIVPVLDEARAIEAALAPLQPHRSGSVPEPTPSVEVVVVDGGSRDGTPRLAAPLADRVVQAPRGRATQMNAGAAAASGDALLFLHADTMLPDDGPARVAAALERHEWGRFDVAIAGADPMLAVVALLMNARSRLTGIATGDQAIFVRRAAFDAVGGFAPIPLMEDIALSRALRRRGRPACLRQRVVTSGRRWERQGTLRTIVRMWRLRLAFALGADPHRLARQYDVERTSS